MKRFLLIILTISSINASGQTSLIGVTGGVARTNIIWDGSSNGNKPRIGQYYGLTYEYLFKSNFSLGSDLSYNQRGFRNETKDPNNEISTMKFNYDYVSLPLKAGYYVGTKLYGFAHIGAIPSILAGTKLITSNLVTDYWVIDIDASVMKRTSKFDLAGLIDLGGGYRIKNKYWAYASIAYQQSFNSIIPDYPGRHTGLTLSIGIKYSLKKA